MMAAKVLGLPKPLLEPEPQLTGLGIAMHRVLGPVLAFFYRDGRALVSGRNIAGLVILLIAIALILMV